MMGCEAFPFSVRERRVPCEVLPAVVCTCVEDALPRALSFEDGNVGPVPEDGFHLPIVMARHPHLGQGNGKWLLD